MCKEEKKNKKNPNNKDKFGSKAAAHSLELTTKLRR